MLSALIVAACGDDDSTTDTTAPTVTSTSPGDGATNVPGDAEIVIIFSEAMDSTVGSIEIAEAGQQQITLTAADGTWSSTGTMVTFTPPAAFADEAQVDVTILATFEDEAGNGLTSIETFSFTIGGVPNEAPTVSSSTPAEGATGVDGTLSSIELVFSEAMAQTGTVTLSGGAGALGASSWNGAMTTLTIPVSGLAYDTDYSVTLAGFTDELGLALEPGVLGDLSLDFATGVDDDAPIVVAATPMEGQLDVAPDLATIVVTFSEAMDTSVTTASLTGDGAGATVLTGAWDGAGTTITFTVGATLAYETDYHLDLAGFSDVLGNALDGVPVVGDGVLDFATVAYVDVFPPFLTSTSPVEGAADVAAAVGTLSLTFSEAMTTTVTDVDFTTSAGTETLTGAWDAGATTITFTVGSLPPGAAALAVDAAGFTDAFGNALDATVLLADGALDFTVLANSGEDCSQPLLGSQATVTPTGALTWTVPAGGVTNVDGNFACDPTGLGPDVVVEVVKTSGTLADGGELLHVRAATSSTSTSDRLNLQIFGGACNAGAAGAVELKCTWYRESWDAYLDVPAGTYYVWVGRNAATTSTTTFPNVTITAEEVPASASEGEACFAPYTTSSANYQAPLASGDPHRWNLPPTIASFDMDVTWGGEGSISCDNHSTYGDITGVDTVVEFTRSSPTSILQVNLVSASTSVDLDIEVFDRCDTTDPDALSSVCLADIDNVSFTSPGTASTMYVWVATELTESIFPGAVLDIYEIEVGPGESRGTAVALSGSGPIVKGSTRRLDPPSCFPATGNVDWYSYTPVDPMSNVVLITPNAAGAIAVLDEGGHVLRCSTDATNGRFGTMVPLSGTIYLALETASAITSLDLAEAVYDGVEGKIEETGITFPGGETLDYWLSYDGAGSLYLGTGSQEVWVSSTGGGASVLHDDTTLDGLTTTNMGYGGVFASGMLWSADTTTTATASRIFRLWDGVSSPWSPVAWDTSAVYPASSAIYTLTSDGTHLYYVTENSGQAAFYRLDPATAGPPVLVGTSTALNDCTGLAVDDEYFYVAGQDAMDVDSVYRVSKVNPGTAPVNLATGLNFNTSPMTSLALDSETDPQYLYIRNYSPAEIHVVMRPDEALPIHLGSIVTVGVTTDYAMTIDRANNALYQFDTSSTTDTILRIR